MEESNLFEQVSVPPAIATIRAILRAIFLIMLSLIVFLLGSAEPVPLHTLAIGFFVLAAFCFAFLPLGPAGSRSVNVALRLALCAAVWALVQIIPTSVLANPVWALLNQPDISGTISVEAGDTLAALIPTMLPFAIFTTAVVLFPDDRSSLFLFKFIGVTGIACAIVGLVQFVFFPNDLLFEERTYYHGSLTAVFVNRNTAATYLGLVLIVSSSQLFSEVQAHFLPRGKRDPRFEPHFRGKPIRITLWGIGALIALTALLLTQSRAGVAFSLLGLGVAAILTLMLRTRATENVVPVSSRIFRALVAVAALGLGAMVVFMFGGRTLLRIGLKGDEDGRFCVLPGILRLLHDNWLTGTGLGTFRVVFPAYRDPACGLNGVWDKAHDFYLEGWITLGLPFVFVCGIGLFVLFTTCITGMRKRRSFRGIPIAGVGVLTLLVAHSALDFSIQIPGFAAVFATLMGAVTTISHGRSGDKTERKRSPRPLQA